MIYHNVPFLFFDVNVKKALHPQMTAPFCGSYESITYFPVVEFLPFWSKLIGIDAAFWDIYAARFTGKGMLTFNLYRLCAKQVDILQFFAVGKSVVSNKLYRNGDCYLSKTFAARKCSITYCHKRFGQFKFGKQVAMGKGVMRDCLHIFQVNAFQCHTTVKTRFGNILQAVGEIDFPQ